MPNHVINEIIFRGVDGAAQDRILSRVCGDDGKVDFEVLVPRALNIWWGSSSAETEKVFRATWYEWSIANWGTKWNAYSQEPTERTDDTLILRFQTAWGPPYPWLAAVLNALQLSFEHNWLSEGGGEGRTGQFKTEGRFGGPDWSEADASPELHRHLHKLLWGVEEFAEEDDAA
jgi:hypothetical protein